jgi:Fe2+ or Zn2+ uptake regulation protein
MLAPKGVARLHKRFASRLAEPPPIRPVAHAQDQAGRPSITERCAALSFRLTQKRQQIAAVFDQIDGPFALEDAYLRCRDQGLGVNRSSVFRLIRSLVDARVLTLVGADHRRALYGAPLPVELMIETDGHPQARIDDPILVEMLVAAAARIGVNVAKGQIVVSIVEVSPTHS